MKFHEQLHDLWERAPLKNHREWLCWPRYLKNQESEEENGKGLCAVQERGGLRFSAVVHEMSHLVFDEHEGWSNGFLTCAHWLTWRVGLAPSAARERVRVARALGELPLISEAMKRGELSYSKVKALTRIARPDTEKSLLEFGRALFPRKRPGGSPATRARYE